MRPLIIILKCSSGRSSGTSLIPKSVALQANSSTRKTPSSAVAQWMQPLIGATRRAFDKSESLIGSLIGVSGCLYGVRRSSYFRIALDMSSDFAIASEMKLQGLRTVYEEEAICV